MLNQETILELFRDFWPKVNPVDVKKICHGGGGISAFECLLIYLHILKTRPRHIVEFSPHYGYSSQAIAMAQRQMRNMFSFATFEIKKIASQKTKERLGQLDLSDYCQVIEGNANVEVPKYIKQKGAHIDLCFIDSDHRAAFAKNYIKEIFPLLQEGCLVGVHDICTTKLNKCGEGEFKTSLRGGHHKSGEESPVKDFIKSKKLKFCILHAITGGKHEGANLANNDDFYKTIQDITGIDFRKVKGPCPKTLFFRI